MDKQQHLQQPQKTTANTDEDLFAIEEMLEEDLLNKEELKQPYNHSADSDGQFSYTPSSPDMNANRSEESFDQLPGVKMGAGMKTLKLFEY